MQRNHGPVEEPEGPRLADYACRRLELKAGNQWASTVARSERALSIVLSYFGVDVKLPEITVAGLSDDVVARRCTPGVKAGKVIAAQTVLPELHALSSL